jgi:hypothetical protein
MAATGQGFASPDEALAAADGMAGGLGGSDATAVAIRDYACRRSTHYAETLQVARDSENAAWMAAHPDIVEQAKSAVASVVALAV